MYIPDNYKGGIYVAKHSPVNSVGGTNLILHSQVQPNIEVNVAWYFLNHSYRVNLLMKNMSDIQ